MRSLVQYDLDETTTASLLAPSCPSDTPPPAKKSKRNHRNSQNHPAVQKTTFQHWDDPGSAVVGMMYDEQGASTDPHISVNPAAGSVKALAGADEVEEEEEEYGEWPVEGDDAEEEEESRELTHGEIWDDSALIDAWNSAEAEYEVYHGTWKSWKTEPVKKSPLWYNKPYTAPSKPNVASSSRPQELGDEEPEHDTAPLDFNTYIPTHDPSLSIPSHGAATNPAKTTTSVFLPPSTMATVSRDEAFNNVLSAMYWCGYWTAVYQCQSQSNSNTDDNVPAEAIEGANGIEADEDEDADDLVPAQR